MFHFVFGGAAEDADGHVGRGGLAVGRLRGQAERGGRARLVRRGAEQLDVQELAANLGGHGLAVGLQLARQGLQANVDGLDFFAGIGEGLFAVLLALVVEGVQRAHGDQHRGGGADHGPAPPAPAWAGRGGQAGWHLCCGGREVAEQGQRHRLLRGRLVGGHLTVLEGRAGEQVLLGLGLLQLGLASGAAGQVALQALGVIAVQQSVEVVEQQGCSFGAGQHGDSLVLEHPAQLLQSGAHLGFHGPDRAAAQLGDLLVGQIPILAQEEYGLFFGSELQQRGAEPF